MTLLSAYTADLRVSSPTGTGLIALMKRYIDQSHKSRVLNEVARPAATASVPGATLTGYLSDRLPLRIVIFLSSAGAAASCLLL